MTLPYRVTILTLTVLLGNSAIAQTAPANSKANARGAWEYALTVDGYIVPDEDGYVSPTLAADRGWLLALVALAAWQRRTLSSSGWTMTIRSPNESNQPTYQFQFPTSIVNVTPSWVRSSRRILKGASFRMRSAAIGSARIDPLKDAG